MPKADNALVARLRQMGAIVTAKTNVPDMGAGANTRNPEGFVAAFAEVYRTAPETLGPNVRSNMEMAAAITLADRAWVHVEQTRISRRFAQALQHYYLILAPVTPVSPFPWTQLYAERVDGQTMRNYYHWLALSYVVTLGTQPALSLPCGRDEYGWPGRRRTQRRLTLANQRHRLGQQQIHRRVVRLGRHATRHLRCP